MAKSADRFGFRIHADRQIDYDAGERQFYRRVLEAEPSVVNCISCGACAATCSAALVTNFSLRKIILLVRRGFVQNLEEEAAKCMLCGKCQLVCPRGVNTRNLILQINKALQNEQQ